MTERVRNAPLPWIGLGAMRHEEDYGDDASTIASIIDVLPRLTNRARTGFLAMLATTGRNVPSSPRVLASQARRRYSLPPWWRLRLAVRRTGWQPPIGGGS